MGNQSARLPRSFGKVKRLRQISLHLRSPRRTGLQACSFPQQQKKEQTNPQPRQEMPVQRGDDHHPPRPVALAAQQQVCKSDQTPEQVRPLRNRDDVEQRAVRGVPHEQPLSNKLLQSRSEERRVGKERRSRWSP